MSSAPAPTLEIEHLESEARLFARNLLRADPGPELIARYVAANQAILPEALTRSDRAVLDCCRRHPTTLPLLDAAAGLAGRGDSRLRQKLLIMTAVLEATTRFAPRFMPPERTTIFDLVRIGASGAIAVGKAGLGLPLWWLVTGRSR